MPENRAVTPVVILTREERDNRELSLRLREAGIGVREYPCIQTTLLPPDFGALPENKRLRDFPVLVFTSKRGVEAMAGFRDELLRGDALLAVVGKTTAAAVTETFGRAPGLTADPPTGEALAHMLVRRFEEQGNGDGDHRGRDILHLRGSKSTGTFKAVLENHGYRVTELVVYRNDMPQLEPLTGVDTGLVVFASPSAARGFFHYNPGLKGRLSCLAIGPTTAGYLEKQGITKVYQPAGPDVNGLERAIKGIFNERFND